MKIEVTNEEMSMIVNALMKYAEECGQSGCRDAENAAIDLAYAIDEQQPQ